MFWLGKGKDYVSIFLFMLLCRCKTVFKVKLMRSLSKKQSLKTIHSVLADCIGAG